MGKRRLGGTTHEPPMIDIYQQVTWWALGRWKGGNKADCRSSLPSQVGSLSPHSSFAWHIL